MAKIVCLMPFDRRDMTAGIKTGGIKTTHHRTALLARERFDVAVWQSDGAPEWIGPARSRAGAVM